MKRVIERCPNCGVEHDAPKGGACEVCGTTLRYWCRVHSREIGWLDGPECPRCAAEAAARVPAPPPRRPPAEAPPPRRPPVEVPPRRPPAEAPPVVIVEPGPPEWDPAPAGPPPHAGRDSRDVLREGAEEWLPHAAAAGAGLAVRMVRALFAVLRAVILWGIFGGIVGGVIAYTQPGVYDLVWTVMFGAFVGGGVGLFFGAVRALFILFSAGPRREG